MSDDLGDFIRENFTQLSPDIIVKLRDAGYESLEDLMEASPEEISLLTLIDKGVLKEILQAIEKTFNVGFESAAQLLKRNTEEKESIVNENIIQVTINSKEDIAEQYREALIRELLSKDFVREVEFVYLAYKLNLEKNKVQDLIWNMLGSNKIKGYIKGEKLVLNRKKGENNKVWLLLNTQI